MSAPAADAPDASGPPPPGPRSAVPRPPAPPPPPPPAAPDEARLDRAITARPWRVEHVVGDAGTFHDRPLPEEPGRQLWLFEVDRPALVLGSAQRDRGGVAPVDRELAARSGIEVVSRRSGGAAVLLEVGAIVWADVVIGREDPLWDDDVGRAPWWVGRWWQHALAGLRLGRGTAAGTTAAGTTVHRGPMRHGPWSDRVCFAGVGPGEVLVGGRKLVGVSQRRTRGAARFQTAALLHWEPGLLARLCAVPEAEAALADVALGLRDLAGGGALTPADVHRALSEALR